MTLYDESENIKTLIKVNIEKFQPYIDNSISIENMVEDLYKIILQYKKEIVCLNSQKEDLVNDYKHTVNYFLYIKQSKINEYLFDNFLEKICLKNDLPYDAKTFNHDGYDLEENHYPDIILERIYNLVWGGYQYAQIVEIYTELE